MPPRKATKKPGKRTIALAKAALDDSPSREDVEMSDMMHLWEAEETVAQMTSEMKKKVEMRCTLMMQQVPFMQESLARALSKASSDVPKRYLNMNLVQYCEEYGEDYDEILLAARTPKEREGFLAQFADEDDGEEEKQDENDPGTTLKGERPPPARQVAATPSGRTRAGGRALRSGIKGAPPAETPSGRTRRAGAATAACAPPSTRARRAGSRAPSILMTLENGLLVTETGPAPQLFTKDGAKFYSPSGKGVAATPRFGQRRGMPSAGMDALKLSLYGTAGDGNTKTSLMKPKVREALRKNANPNLTLYQHLEAIINRKIEEAPSRMAERCDRLRAEWKKGTDDMHARLKAALPKAKEADDAATAAVIKSGGGGGGGGKDAASMETDEVDAGELVTAIGGPATLKLTAAGGPYDGAVFELFLEEDGDARLIGRSSGRKFKLKGVSLPKDTEVSTTHGKFENSGGKVTFTDLGSTNGTEVDGEEADEEKPYDLRDGSKLLIGQSIFSVVITWGH